MSFGLLGEKKKNTGDLILIVASERRPSEMSDVDGTGTCPPRKFPELQVSTEEAADASGRSTLAQTRSWL